MAKVIVEVLNKVSECGLQDKLGEMCRSRECKYEGLFA